MPAYLRIDKDVKQGLIRLQQLIKEYAQFDIVSMDCEQMRLLEVNLDKQSTEYKRHRADVVKKLNQATE